MFTGLVEAVGELIERKATSGGVRLRVASPLAGELSPGDSLAVNGVCLTVILAEKGELHADVGPETVRVTTLGTIARGSVVNLERPLRADSRLGGHFVQGHVDATGTIDDIRPDGDSHRLTIRFPAVLAPYIVSKGSITVNGISLTVAGVDDRHFDVQIIPYTWEHTNLHLAKAGDLVNLESDILGKYVVRAAELAGLTTKPKEAR